MESAHRLCPVSIDLNWPLIYFRHSLQFNVVTPNPILTLSLNILVEIIYDELGEELSLIFDIVHASLSDQFVVVLVALVHLIRHCSE